MRRLVASALCLAGLGIVTSAATAVPITVPKIITNDGREVYALGTVWSPPSASNCTALVRAELQVPAGDGYWRAVRAIGRHRVNVCDGDNTGWTSGRFYVRFGGIQHLRSQPARLCWQAHQTVNGLPSKHVACKRFHLRGGG